MKKNINILDLFSGIGGFSLGLSRAGFVLENHEYAEINKHPIAVYQHHFKHANYVGTVEQIHGGKIEPPDIITFGSPCQDFSIAGQQKGLAGKRSSLIAEAIRIIQQTKPGVFIWENVKGTYSSNRGRDFQAILQAFANIGGYRLEWQLLNTVWFLPQNRERIYLIGHLAGKSEPGVFPFTEDDPIFAWQTKSKEFRFQTPYHFTTLKAGGHNRGDDTYIRMPDKARTLAVGGHSGGLHSDMTVIPAMTPDWKEKRQSGRRFKENRDPMFTLTAKDRYGMLIKSTHYGKSQQDRYYESDGVMACIQAERTGDKAKIHHNNSIRRLTEIECERLQGFPDDWTKYGSYNGEVKEIAKTNRYTMIGNAVTTHVVEAIGGRLLKHLSV